jgi:hypothetical protein
LKHLTLVGVSKLLAANSNSTGLRLVNLLTPINAGLFEFGELTISALMATDDFIPPEVEEPYFKRVAVWLLPDSISVEGRLDEEDPQRFITIGKYGRCLPVCLDVFPIPYGYWLADYLSAGLALPASYLFKEPPEVVCGEAGIDVRNGHEPVGKLSVWHDHWTPLYAKDGGLTRCGILSEMRTSDLESALDEFGLRLGWVVQLRLWNRAKDYGEFELSTRREFFFD